MSAALKKLQGEWYGVLAAEGFPEIEDVTRVDRPLSKWTGVSHNHVVDSDRVQLSAWPETPFSMQENLLYHPELALFCEGICKHGNHSLVPEQVMKILEMQTQGASCREIGRVLGISYVTVHRVEVKLLEWSRLIEFRED